MPDLWVASSLAKGLLDFAAAQGAAPEALLQQAGIDAADIDRADKHLKVERYIALMRAAKEMTGNPALALDFGEQFEMGEMAIVGVFVRPDCSGDAQEEMKQAPQLTIQIQLASGERLRLMRREGRLWLVDGRRATTGFPELAESAFARLVSAARRLGIQTPVSEVRLTYPAPAHRAEYDRVFKVPVVFGSEWNAMQIDEALISLPVALQPQQFLGALGESVNTLVGRVGSSNTMRSRVERALAPLLATGEANMVTVAKHLRTSRQSLHRKLKAEGTTFEAVLDDLRRTMALRFLEEDLSVKETAHAVGFSDATAFSRAFKRWTGNSPRSARPRFTGTGKADD
jgi:AraC-like DNA-binding protein